MNFKFNDNAITLLHFERKQCIIILTINNLIIAYQMTYFSQSQRIFESGRRLANIDTDIILILVRSKLIV